MKSFFSVLIFYCFTNGLTAQVRVHYSEPPYKWALRFSPLGLIDPFDNNITFGAEYAIKLGWSVTTDLSYIFNSQYSQNQHTSGFMIRPAIRRYLTDTYKSYLELDVFYKQAGYRIFDWLGKDCVNDVPSYEQLQEFVLRKQVAGINVKSGITAHLSHNRRLRLELYLGLGVRFKWVTIKNEPNACYLPINQAIDGPDEGYSSSASVPVGVRIVYVIK